MLDMILLNILSFDISLPCYSGLFFSPPSVFTDYVIPPVTPLLLRYYDVTRELRASDYITDYLKREIFMIRKITNLF